MPVSVNREQLIFVYIVSPVFKSDSTTNISDQTIAHADHLLVSQYVFCNDLNILRRFQQGRLKTKAVRWCIDFVSVAFSPYFHF